MKTRLAHTAIVLAALSTLGIAPLSTSATPGGWCCLCMCHAVNENECTDDCIRMQHGKRVIEEPEMNACTESCGRKGVKQIKYF